MRLTALIERGGVNVKTIERLNGCDPQRLTELGAASVELSISHLHRLYFLIGTSASFSHDSP